MYIVDINELYHHGIKGQKWGVRRYQNKDGSYTSAGKKHRASIEGYSYTKTSFKDKHHMTDEELIKRIGRLQKEKQLHELERSTMDRGRSQASDILQSAGKKSATAAVTGLTLYAVKKAVEKVMGKEAASWIQKPKK